MKISYLKLLTIQLTLLLFSTTVLCGSNIYATQPDTGYIGKVWPSEKKTWTDSATGFEITKWTSINKNWHLYFNVESFIDNNHAIIFSDRSGKVQLYKLDLIDGTITQMTNVADLQQSIWYLPKFKTLWYLDGNYLNSLNTETYQSKKIFFFGEILPRSFAVTCDGKWFVYSADKDSTPSKSPGLGPYAIFRLNLDTQKVTQISPDYGFIISHIQTNPKDPNIISYCWQHIYVEGRKGIIGYTPIRIWWINLNGTDGGPLGKQEIGIHRTHEFWFPDGKRMGFSARYIFGPKNGQQFLGSVSVNGDDNYMMPAPVLYAHSQMFKDNIHWVADQYDGPWLVLFTIQNRKIVKAEKLFKHESSWNGQPSHPHPHFSPDGKYVLFSTDKTGEPEVYTIKVNIEK